MLQCVAVCCSVLRLSVLYSRRAIQKMHTEVLQCVAACVAVCCSVVQCVAVRCSGIFGTHQMPFEKRAPVRRRVAVCCIVCCSVFTGFSAVRCTVVQCVAVEYSALTGKHTCIYVYVY